MAYGIIPNRVTQYLSELRQKLYQRVLKEVEYIRSGIESVVLNNAGMEYAMAGPSNRVIYMAKRQESNANGKDKKQMPKLSPPRPPKTRGHNGRWIGR